MKAFNNIFIIAKREFNSYFKSPLLYVTLAAFFFLAGNAFINLLFFFDDLCKRTSAEMIPIKLQLLDINTYVLNQEVQAISLICLVFLPLLTMKLIADEKKNKTLELLMTSPISSMEIILGKFLAITLVWVIIIVLSLIYPLMISKIPSITVDWGCYFSSILGLFLFGLLGIAIGLMASTLIEVQLLSAIFAFVIMAALYYIGSIAAVSDTLFSLICLKASSFTHLVYFLKGTIDTTHITYFLTGTLFVLFVSERILESQRWR